MVKADTIKDFDFKAANTRDQIYEVLFHSGYSSTEISQLTHISMATFSRLKKDPELIDKISKEYKYILKGLYYKRCKELIDLIKVMGNKV